MTKIAMVFIFALVLFDQSSRWVWSAADNDVALDPRRVMVKTVNDLSPPAVQVDRSGNIYLAWFEKGTEEDAAVLWLLRTDGSGHVVEKPIRVNRLEDPPDAIHQSPGMALGPEGEIYLSWNVSKHSKGVGAGTDLRLARSEDGGKSFLSPVTVNDDPLPVSHGFESLTAGSDGVVYAAWLDGRDKEKGDASGSGVFFARSMDGGKTFGKNLKVDGMACPCCRTAMAAAPDGGLLVSWRKVFEGDVRDMVVARSMDRGKTFLSPSLVHKDGWVFPACPHRPPSIGFDREGRLYETWYTEGTDEQPRVLFAVSDDDGKTFSSPISLHTHTTSLPDHPQMAVHPDGTVLTVWEEITGVRQRVVMRASKDRWASFAPVQTLSEGPKATNPAVSINDAGMMAISWNERIFPNNLIILQTGILQGVEPEERGRWKE